MWNTICLSVVGLIVVWISNWIRRRRNQKCDGVLPPGSMGLPLIGETLSLLIPSPSLDLHPFIKTRLQRYGPIFRTNIAGRPAVISNDPELNSFLLQQEGKLVELWYLDTFKKVFTHDGESRTSVAGVEHKYRRSITLNRFGAERLREKLLPEIEQVIDKTLSAWSTQTSVEVKHAVAVLVLEFSAKQIISYDAEKSLEGLSETCTKITQGFMSFPLNIPGTAYHQCLKGRKKMIAMLRNMLKKRRTLPETNREDFLDQINNDMDREKFLSEDFIVQQIFGVLFATFGAVPTVLSLAFHLLSEHPSVLEEMIVEQEAILKNREDPNSSLTWKEYKSMTFTLQVIDETLRLGTISPGLLRRALKDIPAKGFTIPAGWTIMLVTSSLQLDPNIFANPLEFNPWRWKELDSHAVSKNFMPFGGGPRQCPAAEYSRVFMACFFHVLLTKYRWTKIKGKICRNPLLGFGKGMYVKFSEK